MGSKQNVGGGFAKHGDRCEPSCAEDSRCIAWSAHGAPRTALTTGVVLANVLSFALAACSADAVSSGPADSGMDLGLPDSATMAVDAMTVGPDTGAAKDASIPADGDASDAGAQDPAGVFVAVGYGGRTARSLDDGRTWVDDSALVPNGVDDDYLLRSVLWGDGKFLALGWRTMTSVDGKAWVDRGKNSGLNWFGSALYVNARYVAVGGYGMRVESTDGQNWRDHSIDTGASHSRNGLAYGLGAFVSSNDDGVRMRSPDGASWTRCTGALEKSRDVAFGNGVFVALGTKVAVRSIDAGVSFAQAQGFSGDPEGLIFAQGHFTALGNGQIYTSNDGLQWTSYAATGDQRGAIAFGHGTYVRVSSQGRSRSTDGIHWDAPVSDGRSNPFVMLTFGATR
jgi:hypothetical protein